MQINHAAPTLGCLMLQPVRNEPPWELQPRPPFRQLPSKLFRPKPGKPHVSEAVKPYLEPRFRCDSNQSRVCRHDFTEKKTGRADAEAAKQLEHRQRFNVDLVTFDING